jgi:hypothetical protein
LAVTCLTPFTPFFDLAQIWEKPRKLNVALSVMARQSGWERRVNQDKKKQPGVGMIVADGGLGKA